MGSRARTQALDFAGGIGDGAVFFIGGGGGEYYVGEFRGFRHEHFVDAKKFEFAETIASLRWRRKCALDLRRRRRAL